MPKTRDYKKEYRDYHGKPEQIKRRNARNKSRAKLKAAGVKIKANQDVDHKDGNPLNTKITNLRVTSQHFNRGVRNRKKLGLLLRHY
jgi:peptide subunit release factor RF-3